MIESGLPNPHTLAVLILTVVALILFSREKIPLETSSLLVLTVLAVGFEVFPYQGEAGAVRAVDFFRGFGHEALVAVSALMVAGHGLVRSGALEPVGRTLAKMWSVSPSISFLLTLVIAGVLSAFINNTPIVILLLPILVSVSLQTKSNASSLLMPMGFATLIGGMSTTIGTSTNLLVIGVAADLGLRRMEMFDFILPALIANSIGLIYLWLVAPRILPKRELVLADTSPRVFTAHLVIMEESLAAGMTLSEVIGLTNNAMNVEGIRRSETTYIMPLPDAIINPGDRLLVHDTPGHLKEFEQLLGATLYSAGDEVDDDHPLQADDQQLAEAIVFQGSPLQNRTLNEIRFADSYQLVVLAIHRANERIKSMPQGLGNLNMRIGDVLLVQGKRDQISELKQQSIVMVLDSTTDLPHSRKAPYSLAIMLGIILLAATGILPIAVSATGGVLLMLLCSCLSWRDISRALNAQVILIIVASLALGNALLMTGGSDFLANTFVHMTEGASPTIVLSSLILLMAILTNVVSNNAAAVIGTPVAISIANTLQLSPEPFVLAVLFGANMSYATPMAYQTNLLVMSAGNYKFWDFMRVGLPLILIMWLAYSWILPAFYYS
ncbi:MAG: SLC13 family permease [Candidatus Thiodiazotropha sp. (ex Troendleina suluensis)]|nr:SLC13 family permease [Candidatus Thiodiazotropha sp. (ex Troendleina suluensis)]MCU7874657.1 SLC13 family permease [Candidatus Thiodiazotropha sp. (ex Lucinoma borealis)]MCU7948162.1 SLC13 family permease [Candidatus Thiodiazotropha sp. (ex Cardiolucina cf. quadrata)]